MKLQDDEDYIICRDLWGDYISFCKQKSLHSKDDNVFGAELRGLGTVTKKRRRLGMDREYCYVGIRLKQENAQSDW